MTSGTTLFQEYRSILYLHWIQKNIQLFPVTFASDAYRIQDRLKRLHESTSSPWSPGPTKGISRHPKEGNSMFQWMTDCHTGNMCAPDSSPQTRWETWGRSPVLVLKKQQSFHSQLQSSTVPPSSPSSVLCWMILRKDSSSWASCSEVSCRICTTGKRTLMNRCDLSSMSLTVH